MRGQPRHPEGKYRSRSQRGVRCGNRWIVPNSSQLSALMSTMPGKSNSGGISILAHSKLGSR